MIAFIAFIAFISFIGRLSRLLRLSRLSRLSRLLARPPIFWRGTTIYWRARLYIDGRAHIYNYIDVRASIYTRAPIY